MSRDEVGRDGASGRPVGGASRPRRGLLAGAVAAALGVIGAETLASAAPAQATQGQPVIEGTDNTGATARTGIFTAGNKEWAQLADPGNAGLGSQGVYGAGQNTGVRGEAANGTGVIGQGSISFSGLTPNGRGVLGLGSGTGTGVEAHGGASDGPGVVGLGGGSNGTGVAGNGGAGNGIGVIGRGGGNLEAVASIGQGVVGLGGGSNGTGVAGVGAGTGAGVFGTGGSNGGTGVFGTGGGAGAIGVTGTASTATGIGVLAENTAGGNALQVTGKAQFNRSGILTVAAGKSSATKTGVPLTAASLVLATLQQDRAGVYVRSAVPNVSASSFTIHLSKAVTANSNVAWFVVN